VIERFAGFLVLGAMLAASSALAEEGEKKGPPFADKKKAADQPKPADRTWNVLKEGPGGKYAFSLAMKPGIPDPGQVTEVIITANALPVRPDPVYGSQVPLDGARIVVELTNPAGELVGRYLAHAMPLAKGKFGVHLTPSQEGVYTLGLKTRTAKGEEVSADVKLPVKVWPLPAELEGNGDKIGGGGGRAPIKG
jgi:hypothetical protein